MMAAWAMMLALAAQAPGACPRDGSATVAGWADPMPLASGGTLSTDRSATIALLPTASIRFARTPDRAPPPDSFAGLASLDVVAAGRYRIMLDGPAWVDLVSAGRAVASTGHGHGAPCSGVRKMVDFDLKPGTYVLQLSGAKAPRVQVLVTRS